MSASSQPAFISYSREDSRFALRLARDLKAAGALVWLDQLDITAGRPWDDAVEAALTHAPQMVLILSPASAKSNNVRDEISFALNKGKSIIPALYKDCELPLRLQRSQQIDFRTDYNAALASLLQHLQEHPAPAPAGVRPVSRRNALAGAAAAATVLTGGAWLGWPRISHLFQPLPEKRFVALMAWPGGDEPSVVATVLDLIGSRLARAEASVKDLLIISPAEVPANTGSLQNPAQTVSVLGANLVLAASLQTTSTLVTLTLQVLDAATQRVVRRGHVARKPALLAELGEAASQSAVTLLDLPQRQTTLKDPDELQHVTPQVFQLFSDAEQMVMEPNHAGLQGAILKYQQAVDAAPHFALGFARLAMAYTQQFLLSSDPATLKLGASNAALALKYNPESAKALSSQAQVLLYSGKLDDAFDYFARSLTADPGNPETLIYKAQALRNVSRLTEAEQVYRDILKERPNSWLAYNELGLLLTRQGKYQEATDQFAAASSAAQQASLPQANLGSLYLQMGKRNEAIAACAESLRRGPCQAAYMTLGTIAFTDGKYTDALDNYQRAAALNPNLHVVWRDIGDCYAVLNKPAQVQQSFLKAAQLLSKAMENSPGNSYGWSILAFYYAKTGDTGNAEMALTKVDQLGAKDLATRFYQVQALALLKKNEEAVKLLLVCLDQGLPIISVNLAIDLKGLQKDPRYIERVSHLQAKSAKAT